MPSCVGKVDSFPPNTLEDVWRNKTGFVDILRKNNIDFSQLSLRVRKNQLSLCQLFGIGNGADEIEVAIRVIGCIVTWDVNKTPGDRNADAIWHALGLIHEETEIETIDATGLTSTGSIQSGDTSRHDTFIRPPRV